LDKPDLRLAATKRGPHASVDVEAEAFDRFGAETTGFVGSGWILSLD
jgi:hypothetical protein